MNRASKICLAVAALVITAGLATVFATSRKPIDKDRPFAVERDGRVGVKTRDGEVLVPPDYYVDDTKERTLWKIKKDGNEGVIDVRSGEWILPMRYRDIMIGDAFIIGARQNASEPDDSDALWMAFDLAGRSLTEVPPSSALEIWAEPDLLVIDGQRAIDARGNAIIPQGRYDSISPRRSRAIAGRDDRYGLIDATGREVVTLEYAEIMQVDAAREWFRVETADARVGIIDVNGAPIIAPDWDQVMWVAPKDGAAFFIVQRQDQYDIRKPTGEPLFAAPFDDLKQLWYDEPLYLVSRDGSFGLCNLAAGTCPISVKYESLQELDLLQLETRVFVAILKGKAGALAESGETVIPFEYDSLIALPNRLEAPDRVRARRGSNDVHMTIERRADRSWSVTQIVD